jgi:hypothetical protein
MRSVIPAALILLVNIAMNVSPESPKPITKARASEIAQKYVAGISEKYDFVILENRTVERPFGWVFFYTTRQYAQSRDPKYLVPDCAPLVVLRASGSIDRLATSVPPARAIDIYEQRWREKQTGGKDKSGSGQSAPPEREKGKNAGEKSPPD